MTAPIPPPRDARSLPYMVGLDGLRALAVAAVVLYHLEVPWLPGGFLGVDMFFVVSGFLITSLLLADVRRRGRFDVRDFWLRRARRLLPALALMVTAVVLYVAFVLPGELAGLRGEVIAAAGYVTNWALIVTDTSYFEAFSRPPLLRHLWSLAVEEQFYLLWPVAFAAGWALMRRRMLSVVWLGAIASAVAMAVIYEPLTDPSRVYFGTDTRAVGLLVGVGLAYVTTPQRLAAAGTGAVRLRREAAGWAGIAVLALLMVFGDEFSPAMYRGGFLLAAAATMAAVVGAAVPTRLARLLGVPLLVWVGRRSYGIYLWHWPVLMLTRPELDTPLTGWQLSVLQVAATLLLAELSYRFVERPIIAHGFGAWLRGLPRPRRVPAQATALGAAAGLVVVTAAAMATAPLPTEPALAADVIAAPASTTVPATAPILTPPADRLTPEEPNPPATVPALDEDEPGPTTSTSGTATTAPPSVATTAPGREPSHLADRVAETTTTSPPTTTLGEPEPPEVQAAEPERPTVTAIGDSVMLGAAEHLLGALGDRTRVDAVVSRSFGDGVSTLARLASDDDLGDVVLVHLGTNGPIDDDLVDALMEATDTAERVLAVTVRVPRRWEAQVNDTLLAGTERWPRLELVDWHAAADDRPRLFVSDGVHLTDQGRTVYAELIAEAIGSRRR